MSDLRNPGDAWVTAADGNRYWGRFGAAGLLAYDRARDSILLQHRVTWSDHGDTWGIPGGARNLGESAIAGALRESQEEAGVPDGAVRPLFTHVLDRGVWNYTTVIAEVVTPFTPEITDAESHALAWVPRERVADYPLHPAFSASWEHLQPLLSTTPAVVVDAANVVGSVPDGWWRDRKGATERFRDRIAHLAAREDGVRSGFLGLPETVVPNLDRAFPRWILVTEGPAVGITDVDGVQVISAPGLGDDTITETVASLAAAGVTTTVVTSDAELAARVHAVGAAAVRGSAKLVKLLAATDQPPRS